MSVQRIANQHMKLTTIKASNFKGLSFTLDLKHINFLVGSNFAGKTARTDAIRFLLLGYLPELGKTNTASFGLASGREMIVEGTFDNGLTMRRRLYLQGDSVKAENSIPKEIEDAGQLAVMLNAETYFGLSDRERVNYVFANVKLPETYTASTILSQIKLKDQHADNVIDLATDKTPQDFVESALAYLTTEAKAAKEYATRMEKGAQAVTTLKTQDETTALPSKEAIDAGIEELSRTLERQQQEKADHMASYNTIVAARKRRHEIQAKLELLPQHRARLDAILQRLDTNRAALSALPEVTQAQIDYLNRHEADVRHERNQLDAEKERHAAEIAKANAALVSIATKTVCPYCGAAGEGWKTLKHAEIRSTLESLQAAHDLIEKEHAGLMTSYHETVRTLKQALQTLTERTSRLSEIANCERDQATTTHNIQVLEAMKEELANLPAENPELQTKVEATQSAINVTQQAIATNRRQRDQIIAREGELQRIAQAEKQRDEAKTEYDTLVVAGKKLREIQGEMVAAAFKPLLETANSFFGTILKSPLAYHAGEIGTYRAGNFVSHRTFSGTEKALCYAAIQAALASKSPVRIMLIDELGRLDKNNATALQECAETAIRHHLIDQFIGIDAVNRYEADFVTADTQIITVS